MKNMPDPTSSPLKRGGGNKKNLILSLLIAAAFIVSLPLIVSNSDVENEDGALYAQSLSDGVVSKNIVPGFIFEENGDLSYVIAYALPKETVITQFKIVDTYPVASLSYYDFAFEVDGVNVDAYVTAVNVSGTVTFTVDNLSVLAGGDLVVLRVTFNIASVDKGISNNAEVFVNGSSDGVGTEDLYVVSYDANWPGDGTPGTGSVPNPGLYRSGVAVTVANAVLNVDGYKFCGWNTKVDGTGVPYAVGSALTVDEADVVLYAEWVYESLVSKDVVPGFIFEENGDIEYAIAYALPKGTVITQFRIVDTYPAGSLSYNRFAFEVDGVNVDAYVTAVDVSGTVTFTVGDLSVLAGGDLVALRVIFTITSVAAGISNNAEVFVNGVSISSGAEDLYVVSYDANWPGDGTPGTGSKPASGLYKSDVKVTVANAVLNVDG
ncbi:MAG: InlB B-repeat-containing protein, partial [Methanomassiliicoccaceae archaeon]|nr:InlB B-repeat-containing protein [Methanomassiliicoccaceae archaeon]